jgi:hypothetical protein
VHPDRQSGDRAQRRWHEAEPPRPLILAFGRLYDLGLVPRVGLVPGVRAIVVSTRSVPDRLDVEFARVAIHECGVREARSEGKTMEIATLMRICASLGEA